VGGTASAPDPAVLGWLDRQAGERVTVTAMTVAELLVGVTRLPSGRRRRELTEALADVLEHDLAPAPLAFGVEAAEHFAEIVVRRMAQGRPISVPDAVIAATARFHAAVLATRNTRDFDDLDLVLIDPWAG
jgi:predicted nucleic acid-binding protein